VRNNGIEQYTTTDEWQWLSSKITQTNSTSVGASAATSDRNRGCLVLRRRCSFPQTRTFGTKPMFAVDMQHKYETDTSTETERRHWCVHQSQHPLNLTTALQQHRGLACLVACMHTSLNPSDSHTLADCDAATSHVIC
jgi:hypothetical protein